jgi:preprotein translocase SecE subunit
MARNRQRAKDRKLRRENVSGELQHASGEVDEVEASIVAGAEGHESDIDDAELAAEAEQAGAEVAERSEDRERAPRRRREGGPKPQGNRVMNFLRASWSELQRVQWPDRKQTAQATAVTLGFVALAGAWLGVSDWAAQRIVDFII